MQAYSTDGVSTGRKMGTTASNLPIHIFLQARQNECQRRHNKHAGFPYIEVKCRQLSTQDNACVRSAGGHTHISYTNPEERFGTASSQRVHAERLAQYNPTEPQSV